MGLDVQRAMTILEARRIRKAMRRRDDFDLHPDIQYRDTTHFFYGKYPYRVTLKDPNRPRFMLPNTPDHEKNKAVRQAFVERLRQYLPSENRIGNLLYGNPHVMLVDAADTKRLIDAMKEFVIEVHRPIGEQAAEAMSGDAKARVRPNLFHDLFRYRLLLRTKRNKGERQRADDVYDQFFPMECPVSSEKARLTGNIVRSFFVHDIPNVVMLKLVLGREIASVERVILRCEFEGNGRALGAEAG